MKKNYFWSPHIDQNCDIKISLELYKFFNKIQKRFKNFLINVFGEWDKHNFQLVEKINLISKRDLKKKI